MVLGGVVGLFGGTACGGEPCAGFAVAAEVVQDDRGQAGHLGRHVGKTAP
ncbi:hypothetical protein [Streptomyces sp. NPDC018000]